VSMWDFFRFPPSEKTGDRGGEKCRPMANKKDTSSGVNLSS
jgi:hypothetical protein